MNLPDFSHAERLRREVERERRERNQHLEQRAGLAADEEFRIKDARENNGLIGLRRQSGR